MKTTINLILIKENEEIDERVIDLYLANALISCHLHQIYSKTSSLRCKQL